jgi:predicted ATP-grasp superfamily ATP-dependent carboligase
VIPKETRMSAPWLLMVGASARAAAASALRAGYRPWCVDRFADADTQRLATMPRLAADDYPERLPALLATAPVAPWLYLGGLEHRPRLLAACAQVRPLRGNPPAVLRGVRDPFALHALWTRAGVPALAVSASRPANGRWLSKPWASGGGLGVGFASVGGRRYWQEYRVGTPGSLLFVTQPNGTVLFLGATVQLIGEPWLGATGFAYCGNLGPLPLTPVEQSVAERIGRALVRAVPLVGVWGVDCVWADGVPWPVEVNPRYTAGVEVLEWATGCVSLADPPVPPQTTGQSVGKAILYARQPSTMPDAGPWQFDRDQPDAFRRPTYADIPAPGTSLVPGQPILTLFASGPTIMAVRSQLQRGAGCTLAALNGCAAEIRHQDGCAAEIRHQDRS